MSILSFPAMVFSSEYGWPEIEKAHPSITKVFGSVVLPLSFIPPIMFFYAGTMHGDDFIVGYSSKPWGLIACILFLAEILMFFGMGWFIQKAAQYRKVKIDSHDAYLLAAIAPLPLWFSTFGLFVPNLMFNALLGIIAFGFSCGLIYHGVYALRHMHQCVKAEAFTYTVMSASLLFWVLLLFVVMLL